MKIRWREIEYQLYYLYPFALVGFGLLTAGYLMGKPNSVYKWISFSFLYIISVFGMKVLEDRIQRLPKRERI